MRRADHARRSAPPTQGIITARLREISQQLSEDALRDDVDPAIARRKMRLRADIDSHLLAIDALVATGVRGAPVLRLIHRAWALVDDSL